MQVPFTCVQTDFTGPCTRFNTLIQRICNSIDTSSGVILADVYANRSNYSAASNQGSLFVATDQSVIYQSQVQSGQAQWKYAGGIIFGTISGNGGLLSTDAGVLLLTSASPYKLYRWSGSQWVDVSPGTTGSGSGSGSGSGGAANILTYQKTLASGSVAVASPSSPVANTMLLVVLTQDATGGWQPTWDATYVGYPNSLSQTKHGTSCIFLFVGLVVSGTGYWVLISQPVIGLTL